MVNIKYATIVHFTLKYHGTIKFSPGLHIMSATLKVTVG